jgi:hypothetical protein
MTALSGCGGNNEVSCEDTEEGCPAPCAEATSCASTVQVAGDAALSEALAGAAPDTCVVLANGVYGDVELPAGVKLIGRGPDAASVGTLTITGGSGVEVCDLTVGGDGASLAAGAEATFRLVRIASAKDGLHLDVGAIATVLSSEIVGSGAHGLSAGAGTKVTIQDSLVSESKGVGLWMGCGDDCCVSAAARPRLDASGLVVRDNHIAGAFLSGTDAALEDVGIEGTVPGEEINFGVGGDGLVAVECSIVEGRGLHSDSNTNSGILLQAAGASLGGPGPGQGIQVTNNGFGVLIDQASEVAPVRLTGATIDDNGAFGICVRGASLGVHISQSTVARTRLAPFVSPGGGAAEAGDGILWLDGSNVVVEDVTLSENERAGLLIDGPVSHGAEHSLLRNVIADGNGQAPLHQQSLPPDGLSPDLDGSALSTDSTETFPVP